MTSFPFTVVSDAGVDDLIALFLLQKLSPSAHHTIISSFGNVAERFTSQNIQEYITFSAPHWDFMRGAADPLLPFPRPWADNFHGADGAWGVHPPITSSNIQSQVSYPKNKAVISLGPMTEVLSLMKKTQIHSLMIMGGAFLRKGNETPFAEYNIYCDPEAAAEFFQTCDNIRVSVVPLDVTYSTEWQRKQILQAPEATPTHRWLKQLLLAWFDGWGIPKKSDFTLFDPLAIFLLFYPEYAVWKKTGIKVLTKGEKRGQTVFTNHHPSCKVALELKNPNDIQSKMLEIIFS